MSNELGREETLCNYICATLEREELRGLLSFRLKYDLDYIPWEGSYRQQVIEVIRLVDSRDQLLQLGQEIAKWLEERQIPTKDQVLAAFGDPDPPPPRADAVTQQGRLNSPAAAWRPPSRTIVFLSASAADEAARKARFAAVSSLENVGYTVVPDPFASESGDFAATRETQIASSLLLVQLLGANPAGTERNDFLAAKRLARPVLRWRSPALDLGAISARNTPESIAWGQYLADTDPGIAQFRGTDEGVQAILLEKFLAAIDDKVRQIIARGPMPSPGNSSMTECDPRNTTAHLGTNAESTIIPAANDSSQSRALSAKGRPALLVSSGPEDTAEVVHVLGKLLQQAAATAKVVVRAVNPKSALTAAYRGDPGLIVFQGRCQLDWLEQRIEECQQIMEDRPTTYPAMAIYVSPHEGQQEPTYWPFADRFHYLKHPDPAIDAFLAEVAQMAAQREGT